MWQERLSEFVTLLVVINPVLTLPVFLTAVKDLAPSRQRLVAVYAVLVSFGVLLFFAFAGGFLLRRMGIPIHAFQIAGGIVLFVFAITMVIGDDRPAMAQPAGGDSAFGRSIYPVAIPKIAGPGAMLTIMILTDDDRHDLVEKLMTMGVLTAVLAIQLAMLLLAVPILRLIKEGGASIIGRVCGMLLAAMAVTVVLGTLAEWLGLPKL